MIDTLEPVKETERPGIDIFTFIVNRRDLLTDSPTVNCSCTFVYRKSVLRNR